MAGGAPHVDLFDYKPTLQKFDGIDAPDSLYKGERFAFITGRPKMGGSPFSFKQYGKSGAWFSEVLPNLAKLADDLTFLKGMQTTQFNHGPAQVYMNTGNQIQGRPSFGAWLSYGIGSENKDLPAYVVLLSGNSNPDGGSACYGSGFLPDGPSGRSVPEARRSDQLRVESRRRVHGHSPSFDRPHQPDERGEFEAGGRSGNPDANRAVRAGVSDAVQRAGADRSLEGTRQGAGAVQRRARRGVVRQQSPAGQASAREGRALRPPDPSQLGHAWRRGPGGRLQQVPGELPSGRWSDGRVDHGSERAGNVRRHARSSGRPNSAARR